MLHRGLTLRCIGLLMLLLPVSAMAADRFAMQAQQIAPNVYAVFSGSLDFPNSENQGWNSNLAFVVTEEGVLVFDSGSSEAIGEALRREIRKVSDAPIRWLVNSHAHGDHWMGNAALVEEGTEVIATTITHDLIVETGAEWADNFNRMTDGAIGKVNVVAPNVTVDREIERNLGGVPVRFLVSRHAHSPGDMALWLPQQKVLLAADIVYEGRLAATFDSDIPGWIEMLQRAEALGAEIVVPGHGSLADSRALTLQREYFETLWALAEAGFDRGQMDYEVAETARTEMVRFAEHYPDLDENLGASVSHVYLQVEASLF